MQTHAAHAPAFYDARRSSETAHPTSQDSEADAFDSLAREYRAAYDERFGARLRLCGLLRRAAFAPSAFAEFAVFALGASARLRRGLARATRSGASSAAREGRAA